MPTLFASSFASVTASGEFADAMCLIRQFGPFFLAVVFFLWRDWKREDRLSNRLDQLEDEQREVILPLVKDCSSMALFRPNNHFPVDPAFSPSRI
jgi:cbb3-type cytochrome oxidase subunit 3